MANILILDDDRGTIEQLVTLVETLGHNPIASLYPNNITDILQNESIHLLLLDIYMPEKDGLSVLKEIKQHKEFQNLPVIILTGDNNEKLIRDCFDAGAADFISKPARKFELQARIRSTLRLQEEIYTRKNKEQELIKLTQQLQIANEVLRDIATTDPLTNIYNRSYFDKSMLLEWKRGQRDKTPLSLIMLDIDHFKPYNDTYGHQAGDECLCQVADTIHNQCKRPADIVCRYGGEEFSIILPNTDKEGSKHIAEQILTSIIDLKIPHENSTISDYITVSMGIHSCIPDKNNSIRELILHADQALYEAKNAGRNQIKYK